MRAGADLRFLEGGFEKTDQKGVFKHLEIFDRKNARYGKPDGESGIPLPLNPLLHAAIYGFLENKCAKFLSMFFFEIDQTDF